MENTNSAYLHSKKAIAEITEAINRAKQLEQELAAACVEMEDENNAGRPS